MRANTQTTNRPVDDLSAESWWMVFQRNGYYANYVAIATILGGIYLHVTRFFLGDALLLQYVFTAAFDMVLAVPMVYAGILSIVNWKRVEFRDTMHKIGYGLATFYIAASIPLHVQAFFTGWTGYITWFPVWWSILLMPIYISIIVLMWRLRFKTQG